MFLYSLVFVCTNAFLELGKNMAFYNPVALQVASLFAAFMVCARFMKNVLFVGLGFFLFIAFAVFLKVNF